MAGWISSKLKVAETLLQQIDQQAAESLRKSDKPRSPAGSSSPLSLPSSSFLREEIPKRADPSVPLKYQLPKKASGSPSPEGSQTSRLDLGLPRASSSNPDPAVADGDWTQLLSSPQQPMNSVACSHKASKKVASRSGIRASDEISKSRPSSRPAGKISSSDGSSDSTEKVVDSRKSAEEITGNVGDLVAQAEKDDNAGVVEPLEEREHPGEAIKNHGANKDSGRSRLEVDDTETDSGSSDDSQEENRREERRKRRQQMIAEKRAAAAMQAVKEREDLVAKLEGEKQSLEKILEEREKQQAQEASELQTSMFETMEAVEIEKQKHNSTRMEVFARLAELEAKNVELAKSLAATQWNLEVKVTNVAELRQKVELKEIARQELKRRLSDVHRGAPLSQVKYASLLLVDLLWKIESSRRNELEQQLLDAEFSFISDRIVKLKEKAEKLQGSIELTKRAIEHPTEMEVELKKRLSQLTDHLIQKQTQVEALSAEKATVLLRIETISRLLEENGLSTQAADAANDSGIGFSSSMARIDLESGTWLQSNTTSRPVFADKIRSGKQQLQSILHQLDSVFSLGAIFLKRNLVVQICSLLYVFCLHVWVFYILMSHSKVSDRPGNGAALSLESINRTG